MLSTECLHLHHTDIQVYNHYSSAASHQKLFLVMHAVTQNLIYFPDDCLHGSLSNKVPPKMSTIRHSTTATTSEAH